MGDEIIHRRVARRRLLGKAGAVAATVAGAGAVSAAVGSPAHADIGDPVVAGQANDGENATTSLSASVAGGATLALSNGATQVDEWGASRQSPALRLTPAGHYAQGQLGSLGVSTDGRLWLTSYDPIQDTLFPDAVRTDFNSTVVKTFAPVRILDTRPEQSGGKAAMLNPSVINPQGFLPANQTLHLNLDSLLVWGWTIFANITVVAGASAGYLAAYPGGAPLPLASNVNFTPGAVVANFAVIGVGTNPTYSALNSISLYVNSPAKIILDIAGAVVNYDSDIIESAGLQAVAEAPRRVRPANLRPRTR